MREMLQTTAALSGQGLGRAGRADHRRPLLRARRAASPSGHIAPEAAVGGPIAIIKEGDTITLDIPNRSIQVELSEEEIQRRLGQWQAPAPQYTTGALAKYARLYRRRRAGPFAWPMTG